MRVLSTHVRPFVAALLLVPSLALYGAETHIACNLAQGFNFDPSEQAEVGFIDSLKISDTQLDADLNVMDPVRKQLRKVVGVVSGIAWNGGYADPIQFIANVSAANKEKLAVLAHKSMSNTEVAFSFSAYAYDPRAKAYFRSFHTNDDVLKGLIVKRGGELAFNVEREASGEVPSPKNYTVQLGVMPQDMKQEVQLAVSTTDKFAKPWGVEVAK